MILRRAQFQLASRVVGLLCLNWGKKKTMGGWAFDIALLTIGTKSQAWAHSMDQYACPKSSPMFAKPYVLGVFEPGFYINSNCLDVCTIHLNFEPK